MSLKDELGSMCHMNNNEEFKRLWERAVVLMKAAAARGIHSCTIDAAGVPHHFYEMMKAKATSEGLKFEVYHGDQRDPGTTLTLSGW